MAVYNFTFDYSGSYAPPGPFGNGEADDIYVTVTNDANGSLTINGDFQPPFTPVDSITFILPEGATYTQNQTGTYSYNGTVYLENGNSFTYSVVGRLEDIQVVCFTRGARIETAHGMQLVEDLRMGDLVRTRDHGLREIRWIGSKTCSAETLDQFPELRPVRFAAGALDGNDELLVSPAHRMLLTGWRAELLFGEAEVLAAAKLLLNDSSIQVAHDLDEVEYFHILFDDHEIIRADGAWSESFHPAALSLGSVSAASRDEVLALFPELEGQAPKVATARYTLTAADVEVVAL
ncbi:MAG: Hint domain-containing protein [Pseudomonadota bacterium]